MLQVWKEIQENLSERAKSYTLDKLASKTPEEMYYI
jgi:hypothetical protein